MLIYTQPRSQHFEEIDQASVDTERNPVDLVHLGRQTLGDRNLEQEVLALFKNQSCLFLSRLECAKTGNERKLAAHTILGSARGIGAWQVAECAKAVEYNGTTPANLKELAQAIEAANSYISTLLDD